MVRSLASASQGAPRAFQLHAVVAVPRPRLCAPEAAWQVFAQCDRRVAETPSKTKLHAVPAVRALSAARHMLMLSMSRVGQQPAGLLARLAKAPLGRPPAGWLSRSRQAGSLFAALFYLLDPRIGLFTLGHRAAPQHAAH